MIIFLSPWHHYVATACALILEETIFYGGSWVFWLVDSPNKAGETFVSEYTLIISIRWITVLIFQRSLLIEVIKMTLSIFSLVIYGLRKLIYLTKSGRERNSDGTFAPSIDKKVGRPKRK